jgi:hypothetical protein
MGIVWKISGWIVGIWDRLCENNKGMGDYGKW